MKLPVHKLTILAQDEARLSDVVNVSRLAELKHKFDETGFKLLTGTYWK